jgi:elongation factor 1 alpha-like protein
MSRHRNVRHLVAEGDYYDDEDYYDDDYYDDFDDYGGAAPMAPKTGNNSNKAKQTQPKKPQQQQSNSKLQSSNEATAAVTSPPPGFASNRSPSSGTDTLISTPSMKVVPGSTVASTAKGSVGGVLTSPGTTTTTSSTNVSATPPPLPAILKESSSGCKPTLTVVILGHVDAGKSTVTGHLLYRNQQEQQSSSPSLYGRSRPPTNWAWLLDEDDQERAHGVTMDIATKTIETARYNVVLQDAPGHADYVPAMITGTASADAALLVVDATDGAAHTALQSGQLKEHAYVARGLGVNQILVVINKMDLVDWSQEVYESMRFTLETFLTSIGYAESKLRYVPVSGLTGVNVYTDKRKRVDPTTAAEYAALSSWYENGPTLWQALDGFVAPVRKNVEKPLLVIVTDVLGEQGKGVAVRAKMATGWLGLNETLIVLPIGDAVTVHKLASVQSLEASGSQSSATDRSKYAISGELVDLTLTGIDVSRISTGSVLCREEWRPPLGRYCRAKIWILDALSIPLIRGAQAIFHMHHLDVPCYCSKLIRTLQKDGVTVAKERPRALTANTQAIVELTLSNAIAMEAFTDCRALGRFVLRRNGDSVAVGRIEEVLMVNR